MDWQKHILPNKTNGLSAYGKWDAAFELAQCTPVGFNLANSPFGNDKYDYAYTDNLIWKDVFDGFIFYEPYYNHTGRIGFPFKLSSGQAKEIVRRTIIYDEAYNNVKNARLLKWFGCIAKNRIKKDYNYQRSFPCIMIYENSSQWRNEMGKWIDKQ